MRGLVTGLAAARPGLAQRAVLRCETLSIGDGSKGWRPRLRRLAGSISQQQRFASSKSNGKANAPPTALFFPGQGVQRVGMLKPWIDAFPQIALPFIQEIDDLLGYKLSTIIEEGPNSTLTATVHAQPAIMATSILILRILEREFGFHPPTRCDFTLGHSLGEFAALVAAGHVAFADSLHLVRARAAVMAACSRRASAAHGGEYGMVALVSEPEHLPPLVAAIHDFIGHAHAESGADGDVPPIQQVHIANVNSKSQLVLSGSIDMIRTLLTHVRSFGGHDPRAVRLKSDAPFHSPLMRPAAAVMRRLLRGKSRVPGRETEDLVVWPGVMPIVSNVSARPIASRAELVELWARQAVDTVRWWDSIKYLDQERGVRRWIGIGPGKVGRNLVGKEVGMRGKDTVKGGGVWGISDPREIEEVLRGLEETEGMGWETEE